MGEVEPEAGPQKRPRWWRQIPWLALLPRLALAVAGVGALVVGLRAAWIADAATPALVVAAVLLALAVIFTSDLEELSARFKEGELRYKRREHVEVAAAFTQVTEALQVALAQE